MRAIALCPVFALMLLGCEEVRDSARIGLDLQRRYPGSRVEVHDLREGDARRVEVTIRAGSFGDLDLRQEGREIAESVHRSFDLSADTDTVAVAFQADRRMGILSTSQSEQFEYPVSELDETRGSSSP